MLSTVPAPTRRLRPPFDLRAGVAVMAVATTAVATVWAARRVGFTAGPLVSGLGDTKRLALRMWPPRPDDLAGGLRSLWFTFLMAVAGTTLAATLSIPVGFLAARNTTPGTVARLGARAVITATRAIPELVFAIVFVLALSIGPLPGVLALGIHSIGMLGKLLADAIEEIDDGPREAALSAGSGRLQSVIAAVVPQVLPSYVGAALYRLDINMRASVVLGLVGAGGIGFELQSTLNVLRYRAAFGLIILIFGLILIVERLSIGIRRSLFGDQAAVVRTEQIEPKEPTESEMRTGPRRLSPPWTRSRKVSTFWSAILGGLALYSVVRVGADPVTIVRSLPKVVKAFGSFAPPDLSSHRASIITGMVETIAIAVTGVAVGLVAALPLGLLAARSTTPHRVVYLGTRFALVVLRGIPEFIIALLFVAAVGLGPLPGALAGAVFAAGFLGKLFADALEEVGEGPIDAARAVGATRAQAIVSAVIPQAMPRLLATGLYGLDVSIRSSSVLGLVGAGGIGFLLSESSRSLEYRTTGGILVAMFGVVYALELAAGRLRAVLR